MILNVLVVDDEKNIRRTLKICLEGLGHTVTLIDSLQEAKQVIKHQVFDLAFIDLRLQGESGIELIVSCADVTPWTKTVVITAFSSIESAVNAIQAGATDYLAKPFTPDQVKAIVKKVADVKTLENRMSNLAQDLHGSLPGIDFNSENPSMRTAINTARRVAQSDATILLRGESGTGKTLLAKAVHGWSPRADKPLAVVSCPSLPCDLLESELFGHTKGAFTGAVKESPGRIAFCEGGTLFLDEISELPYPLQAKLLRFLQDKEYERIGDHLTKKANVRIVVATNSDLESLIKAGRFREDLFYRLSVVPIDLPPLRARPEDIERLVRLFLSFFATTNHRHFHGVARGALDRLKQYHWPGNVREMKNVIERAAILAPGPLVELEDLFGRHHLIPPEKAFAHSLSLEEVEAAHIRRVVGASDTLNDAAKVLGIDLATLWRKRKKYGI